jgi:4-diphosphocytidyl-2-C-methyl-D-erythritol kinase
VSGRAASVEAQAKINLFLHVRDREPSGYHQIETLFCRLDLADDVVVRGPAPGKGSARALESTGDDTGPPEENLAYRAAVLYAEQRGWPSGFTIEITKRIPVGGGLGGGSADAGAVLRVLRALDPEPPPAATMQLWAAQLGADVPFMAMESPLALGSGHGEILTPLAALPARGVVLYIPSFRVSTRDAYGWLDEARATPGAERPPAVREAAASAGGRFPNPAAYGDWDRVAPLMTNDFQQVVGERYGDIPLVVSRLRAVPNVIAALMSGSGSTVYGVMHTFDAPRGVMLMPADGSMMMTSTAEQVVGVQSIE